MKARAVVLDGVRFETIKAAALSIKGTPCSLTAALVRGASKYLGHAVAYASEVEAVVEAWKPKTHKPGTPLLVGGHVTHRLGAYKEQRV